MTKKALLTTKDIKQFIIEGLNKALAINKTGIGAPKLAEMLKVCPDSIRKWTHSGMPHHKVRIPNGGFRNTYKLNEVKKWLKDTGRWN